MIVTKPQFFFHFFFLCTVPSGHKNSEILRLGRYSYVTPDKMTSPTSHPYPVTYLLSFNKGVLLDGISKVRQVVLGYWPLGQYFIRMSKNFRFIGVK